MYQCPIVIVTSYTLNVLKHSNLLSCSSAVLLTFIRLKSRYWQDYVSSEDSGGESVSLPFHCFQRPPYIPWLLDTFLHLQSQQSYTLAPTPPTSCCQSLSLSLVTAREGSLFLRIHDQGRPTQMIQDNNLTSSVKSLITSIKSICLGR